MGHTAYLQQTESLLHPNPTSSYRWLLQTALYPNQLIPTHHMITKEDYMFYVCWDVFCANADMYYVLI